MKHIAGFTLLEVLVAMAVFALLALSTGRFNQQQLSIWTHTEAQSIALLVAANAMERARSGVKTSQRNTTNTQANVGEQQFIVETDVTQSGLDNYQTISVKVRHVDANSLPLGAMVGLQSGRYVK